MYHVSALGGGALGSEQLPILRHRLDPIELSGWPVPAYTSIVLLADVHVTGTTMSGVDLLGLPMGSVAPRPRGWVVPTVC